MEEHKSGFCLTYKKTPKTGSGTKEKAYYLSNALQFTVPYIEALGKPSGNLPQRPPEEEEGPALGDGGNDNDDLLSHNPLSTSFSTTTSFKIVFAHFKCSSYIATASGSPVRANQTTYREQEEAQQQVRRCGQSFHGIFGPE